MVWVLGEVVLQKGARELHLQTLLVGIGQSSLETERTGGKCEGVRARGCVKTAHLCQHCSKTLTTMAGRYLCMPQVQTSREGRVREKGLLTCRQQQGGWWE